MDKNFSLVLTGEWPGAGQSTTAKLLAQKLGFERVYAGQLQRKFAHVWNLEKNHFTWNEYDTQVQSGKINLKHYPFDESNFNEGILHQWQNQLKKVNTPEFWDKEVEKQSLLALQKPGIIVEAKVGVLLDKTGLGTFDHLDHSVFKFLLTCPPEVSAHRVIKRKIEMKELKAISKDDPTYSQLIRHTTQETIARHLRDWERYEKIYGIKRSDIYHQSIIKVSTDHRSQEEVAQTILSILEQKSP